MTKNKKIKRGLIGALLILIMLSLLCTAAFAAEGGEDSFEEKTTAEELEGETAENPFALFFDTVKEYATEIFCSLTLICSLILSRAYKKGLVPTVSSALSGLGSLVGKVKDSAERGEEKSEKLAQVISERLDSAENLLNGSAAAINEIGAKLDALASEEDERIRFRTVIEGQTELLYDVFMSSSLPQYKKDEIGERVAKMREELRMLEQRRT